jgi:RNA polymerase sigma-70 factor, ECF subfamily
MDRARRKTIHEAMVRLSDGDRSAFPLLIDELWPVILSFTQRAVPIQDAEDVAQQVFVSICGKIADFDRTRDGLSWAFGIASYEIMTHRRKVQRRKETFDGAELVRSIDPAETPEEALIRHDLGAALASAIGELSEADRLTLGLLTTGEPAPNPGATLRKRRQRAIDRLRTLWRTLYGRP